MSEFSKSTPNDYDPITYHHWQEFELRRLRRSSDDFQQLFEDIMVRARPGFIRVRPYGNIGDRKCDGLFRGDSVFFQVYSPDELEQAKVQKKIDEDLDGAVAHWGEALKIWTFVYNVRRGLPPDIPGTLQEKQKQYPNIEIAHLSNDDLWETARGLSVEQRNEILGLPPSLTVKTEHLIIPLVNRREEETDWQKVCRAMLDRQIQFPTLNDLMAKDGIRVDPAKLFVPVGLVERKQKQYRRSDVSSAEQASQLLQPIEEEIVKRFDNEEAFLSQVIYNSNSSNASRLVITGEPGAGKTTLLQKIGDRLDRKGMFPVWISLGRKGVPPTYEFLSHVLKENAQSQNVESSEWDAIINALLQTGKVWLLLDGADELTTDGNPLQVIGTHLRESWTSQVKIILTCRLNTWDTYALPEFKVFRTLEFDYRMPVNGYQNQIEAYIHQFFTKDGVDLQLGYALIQQLQIPGKERIRDSVKNPLRLSLLCYIWESGVGELPDTRAELYRLFVDYYYDLQELKHPEIRIDRIERDALNLMLGEVAKAALDSHDSRFRLRKSLIEAIPTIGTSDAKDSLFDKAVRLGWLTPIGTTAEKPHEAAYAFFHASFQEYFAALAIDDWGHFLPRNHQDEPIKNCKREVNYRIFESQWQEVILLWLERSENLDQAYFIKRLIKFNDGCGYFYYYRAYFLAALGVNKINFFDSDEKREIVRNLVSWGFDYTNTQQKELDLEKTFEQIICTNSNYFYLLNQQWQAYTFIETVARRIIQELDNKHVISELKKVIETCRGRWDLEHWLSLAATTLLKLDSDNPIASSAIIKILEEEGHSMRVDTIYELGESMIKHNSLITCLRNILVSTDSRAVLGAASYSLDKLLPENRRSLEEKNLISKYLTKNLDSVGEKDDQEVGDLQDNILQVENIKTSILNKIYTGDSDPIEFYSLYERLWNCAQNMSYPDFYEAWHSSPFTNTESSTNNSGVRP